VVGLPCHIGADGAFEHKFTGRELEDYEVSLRVMGKHCDVLPCRVSGWEGCQGCRQGPWNPKGLAGFRLREYKH